MRQLKFARICLAKGLLTSVVLVTVQGSTFTTATGTDTSLGTAQLINLNADLIVQQAPPNYTLGTAQDVSPDHMAYDVLGSLTAGHSQEFFSFNVNDGAPIAMQVSSANPATQPTELLLYDQNGNLVAVASRNASDGSSSVIDFTVPSGAAGNWTAEVIGPSGNFFNYDLGFTSPINYTTDVLGALTDPSKPAFYSIAANAGDPIHLFASSTNPLHQPDELLLYDQNGDLVAVAAGNASDGISSVIDFTVFSGGGGNWTAEVAGSPNVPDPSTDLFSYDLLIQGATGTGLINPLAVPTPEPSYFVLLACSLAGFGLFQRLRTKRSGRP